jgi:hypothetical protein
VCGSSGIGSSGGCGDDDGGVSKVSGFLFICRICRSLSCCGGRPGGGSILLSLLLDSILPSSFQNKMADHCPCPSKVRVRHLCCGS